MNKAARVLAVVFGLSLLSEFDSNSGQHRAAIASGGETLLRATSGKSSVRVLMRTHEVQNGSPSEPSEKSRDLGCTNSRFPCSLVDKIEIVVNEEELFVPRSVFADLADLSFGELKLEKAKFTLILVGGDASESYVVKVQFGPAAISRRVFSSALLPNKPLQETIYHSATSRDVE